MALEIEPRDYEFLISSMKFCNYIDDFKGLLDIDENEVQEFKYDHEILIHVFDNAQRFASCADSFVRFQVGNIRDHFNQLSDNCRRSDNYTPEIGLILGIETSAFAFQNN